MKLKKKDLLSRVQTAVPNSYSAVITGTGNPFLLDVLAEAGERKRYRVYIWNLTPGGRNRLDNEYRIQRTGQVLRRDRRVSTLVLGWHEGYGVFAAFDIRRHLRQSSSPSLQIKEEALLSAHTRSFAAYKKGNGEIAIAFKPQFLLDYARICERIHETAEGAVLAALDHIDEVSDRQISRIRSQPRREIVRTLKQKYREHDFRARVLGAYNHQCAVCGIQLGLVEAAHILPVQTEGSTDETTNGIALCVLHHRAYDRGLISFDTSYRIQTSRFWVAYLRSQSIHGGIRAFRKLLKPALSLPADRRDHPNPQYVRRARIAKRWRDAP
jgi:putative restriction endonuclease